MHLATVLSEKLRSLHRVLQGDPTPICHRCGSSSLLRNVVQDPVYKSRQRLHQFQRAVCDAVTEELR